MYWFYNDEFFSVYTLKGSNCGLKTTFIILIDQKLRVDNALYEMFNRFSRHKEKYREIE